MSLCDEVLDPYQQKLSRIDLLGNEIPDKDLTDRTLDEHESKRRFYNSIRDYMVEKACKLGALRLRYNLPPHEEPPDADYMDVDDSYFSGIHLSSTPPRKAALTHQSTRRKRRKPYHENLRKASTRIPPAMSIEIREGQSRARVRGGRRRRPVDW